MFDTIWLSYWFVSHIVFVVFYIVGPFHEYARKDFFRNKHCLFYFFSCSFYIKFIFKYLNFTFSVQRYSKDYFILALLLFTTYLMLIPVLLFTFVKPKYHLCLQWVPLPNPLGILQETIFWILLSKVSTTLFTILHFIYNFEALKVSTLLILL